MKEVNFEMAKSIYESACSVLDGMGIKYQKVEEKFAILFGHKGKDLNHDLIFIVNAEQEAIQLVERLPFAIEPEKAKDVAAAVCLLNERILVGKFSYNLADRLSFEVTQIYPGSLIGEATIERMIMALVIMVEEYDDKFMALNRGYLSVEDFK